MNVSNTNLDAILTEYAKELVKKDIELAQSIDTSKTVVSKKTLNKVRSMIRNYDKKTWWGELPIILRRAVAIVLIICTISFVMCLSVEAIRSEIVNTIVELYDKFVSILYIAEKTPPTEIEEYKEPTLQLPGTEKILLINEPAIYAIMYTKEGNPILQYQQEPLKNDSFNVDNENNCTKSNVKVKEYTALLFTYEDGTNILTWNDNEYSYIFYTFTNEIAMDTLILMAESIS